MLDGQSALLTPGEYRRGENRVGGPDGESIFTTPRSGDVPELVRALAAWLGADTSTADGSTAAPVRAALAHLEFAAIHPFNDGRNRSIEGEVGGPRAGNPAGDLPWAIPPLTRWNTVGR